MPHSRSAHRFVRAVILLATLLAVTARTAAAAGGEPAPAPEAQGHGAVAPETVAAAPAEYAPEGEASAHPGTEAEPSTHEDGPTVVLEEHVVPPEQAVPLYELFLEKMAVESSLRVAAGVFGADMKVSLTNDGPVTIWMDSKEKE